MRPPGGTGPSPDAGPPAARPDPPGLGEAGSLPCHLDGRWLPLAEARVHPLDRGFLFGDGVYEVVKVAGGRLLFLAEHLARLADGLAALAIELPGGGERVAAVCRELASRAGLGDGSLYLQVTRGAGPREKLPPTGLPPTFFAFPSVHPHAPHASRGLAAVSQPDVRWGRCDVKSVSLAATVLGKLAARDAGADEVLFVGPAGELREGGSTNLLVRSAGRLWTHPEGPRILPGVTRRVLLDAARGLGLQVAETAPRLAERARWDEAILCGTLTGVQALVRLDGEPVGGGRVGEWTRRLGQALAEREGPSPSDLC